MLKSRSYGALLLRDSVERESRCQVWSEGQVTCNLPVFLECLICVGHWVLSLKFHKGYSILRNKRFYPFKRLSIECREQEFETLNLRQCLKSMNGINLRFSVITGILNQVLLSLKRVQSQVLNVLSLEYRMSLWSTNGTNPVYSGSF